MPLGEPKRLQNCICNATARRIFPHGVGGTVLVVQEFSPVQEEDGYTCNDADFLAQHQQ
jgi:hypothetical protein